MIRKMRICNRVRVPTLPANHRVADLVRGAVEAKFRCVWECQDESGSQYYCTVTCKAGEEAALPGIKPQGGPGRRYARGEREIELSSTATGEEVPVGDEGDQRHEHDRPEQGGEQQREQNPEKSESSAPSAKASSAKASRQDQ